MSAAQAGSDMPILIAGAGIGGLTAALLFGRAGHPVTVLEKRTRIEEVGAGIQLSPNASQVLIGLGLGQALGRAAGEPERLMVRRGVGGARLVTMPLGKTMRERFGAPYYVVHRADLQTVLLDAVRSLPNVRLLFGRTVTSVDQEGDEAIVSVTEANGPESYRGGLLIGADGLWSRVAAAIGDQSEPDFTGFVAWRGVVDAEKVPPPFRRQETGLWLGPGAHVVHYPLRAGKLVNVVGVVSDRNAEPGWSRPGASDQLRRRFRTWSPELKALFDAVPDWQVWSLFDRAPRTSWTSGRTVLLGDAAHPILPFLAQGGAFAIEDAAVLAHRIKARPNDVPAALAAYAALRRPRAAAIQSAARRNGSIYHMQDPFAFARDLVMKRIGGDGLMNRYTWLYDWSPGAE